MTNPIIRLREALAQGRSEEAVVELMALTLAVEDARADWTCFEDEAEGAKALTTLHGARDALEYSIRSLLSTNDELRSKLEAAESRVLELRSALEEACDLRAALCRDRDGNSPPTDPRKYDKPLQRWMSAIDTAIDTAITNTKGTR